MAQNICANLTHQHYVRVLFVPHPWQHLVLSVILILVIREHPSQQEVIVVDIRIENEIILLF